MNPHALEDHMVLVSQLYSGAYSQIIPQQGEAKPRRRRKKNKGGDQGGSGGGIKKRKLSAEQVNMLETNFGNEHKLESERKDRLASELGLDPRQVAVWFQNRRARWKNKKLEEEYCNLKKVHESIILEKCRLETEVLKLKEQLSEAEKDIQQLLERADRVSNSNSPSSSQSVDAVNPPFLGDLRVEAYDDGVFYMQQTHYINDMDDWMYM